MEYRSLSTYYRPNFALSNIIYVDTPEKKLRNVLWFLNTRYKERRIEPYDF